MERSNVTEVQSWKDCRRRLAALDKALDESPELYVPVFTVALRQAGGSMSLHWDGSGAPRLGFTFPADLADKMEAEAIRQHARTHGMMEAVRQSIIQAEAMRSSSIGELRTAN